MKDRPLRFGIVVASAAALVAIFGFVPRCQAQPPINSELPVVWVLSTGGTIAGRGASATDLSNYRSASLLGEELVASVPQIKQVASVKVDQIVNVASQDLTVDNWITIAKRINTIFMEDPRVAGIVVTHGTSTLEETGYFLNLTVKSDRPVVLVGAMRPATAISSDGPLNLLNAIRTAVAPESRGKGVLIVMNDEINGARDVTKTNTYRVETMRAPELGLLGYVDEDKVSFYRASTKRHTLHSEFDISRLEHLPKVEILYSYVEPDAALLHALVVAGAKGIVFAGLGSGVLSSSERAAVRTLQSLPEMSRPVLVRSSRVGNGRVIARNDHDALGMIPADTLNPQKARILLMLALTKTTDINEIKKMFSEY